MDHSKKSRRFIKLSLFSAVVMAAGVSMMPSAFAADTDPFHVEDGHWMSLDFYKDELKSSAASTTDAQGANTVPPHSNVQAPDFSVIGNPVKETSSSAPVVAAPTRPLNLPVMPGLNKGYEVNVRSTADDVTVDSQLPTLSDAKPDIVLPEKHWQNAVDFAHDIKHATDDDDDSEAKQEIDVRMSFLPNKAVVPASAPEPHNNHGRLATPALAQSTPPAAQKSSVDAAACAAIDAYKKKQLEAIQGDRETLAALQSAIAQLGLQKQLNFITAGSNIMNAESTTTAPKLDMPETSKP